MVAEHLQQFSVVGTLTRPVGQAPRQAQCRKSIAAPPSCLIQRRMSIKPIWTQDQFSHRAQVLNASLVVTWFFREVSDMSQNGTSHVKRVAHFQMVGHDFTRLAIVGQSLIRRGTSQLQVDLPSFSLGPLGQLREDQMARQPTSALGHHLRWTRAIFGHDAFHVRQDLRITSLVRQPESTD